MNNFYTSSSASNIITSQYYIKPLWGFLCGFFMGLSKKSLHSKQLIHGFKSCNGHQVCKIPVVKTGIFLCHFVLLKPKNQQYQCIKIILLVFYCAIPFLYFNLKSYTLTNTNVCTFLKRWQHGRTHNEKPLTDLAVKQAKTREKVWCLVEADRTYRGLQLAIFPNRAKRWRLPLP